MKQVTWLPRDFCPYFDHNWGVSFRNMSHNRFLYPTETRANEYTHEFHAAGFGVLTTVDITPCVINKCLWWTCCLHLQDSTLAYTFILQTHGTRHSLLPCSWRQQDSAKHWSPNRLHKISLQRKALFHVPHTAPLRTALKSQTFRRS